MSFASYRNTLLAGALILAGSTTAVAQHAHTAACGTHAMESTHDRDAVLENTRRNNPELYARIMKGPRAGALMDGTELSFLVRNRVTNQLEEIVATLVYDGRFSRVWVDNRDTGKSSHRPTSNTMRTLFKALDTAVVQTNITPRDASKGILQNDIEVFGDIPRLYNVENKTDFLLLDIKDAVAGQNVLGYFSPTDQTETAESNRMNLLYIDSREGFQNLRTLLAIIAHEFQHLIHYGRHNRGGDPVQRDVALNEGMSEVASILNGYHFRANSQYLQNTNLEFFEWHYDNANDQEIDYQRAMTFAHYLQEQYGERYLYELTGSPEANMARITDALRRYGMPEGYDYKEVLKGFAVANYLQTSSNHAWGYQYRLSSSSARPHLSYTGPSFPASGSASVNSYGTYYVQYTSPGAMRFRISGSGDIRTMLIGIRASDTTVVELEPNTDYTLPVWEGGAYSRMAIAFVNTGGGLREVNWTAEALTSAADLETGATGRLAVQSVESNDADRTTIAYAVPVAGAVRLELFDVNGTRVATLVDDVRIAGAHRHALDVSGLASGTYVARLVQGGATASAMVFVTR